MHFILVKTFSPLIGIIYWFDDTLTKITLNYQLNITHCALNRGGVAFLEWSAAIQESTHDERKGDKFEA